MKINNNKGNHGNNNNNTNNNKVPRIGIQVFCRFSPFKIKILQNPLLVHREIIILIYPQNFKSIALNSNRFGSV